MAAPRVGSCAAGSLDAADVVSTDAGMTGVDWADLRPLAPHRAGHSTVSHGRTWQPKHCHDCDANLPNLVFAWMRRLQRHLEELGQRKVAPSPVSQQFGTARATNPSHTRCAGERRLRPSPSPPARTCSDPTLFPPSALRMFWLFLASPALACFRRGPRMPFAWPLACRARRPTIRGPRHAP